MTEYKYIFLDTAPIIYYLQKEEMYFQKIKELLYVFRTSGTSFVSSDITISEYSVMPIRNGNLRLLNELNNFIVAANMKIMHTSENIATEAAKIRANYKGFKAMDAFQLAFAINSNCDLFLTNDKQLRQFKGIKCMTIDDFYSS